MQERHCGVSRTSMELTNAQRSLQLIELRLQMNRSHQHVPPRTDAHVYSHSQTSDKDLQHI